MNPLGRSTLFTFPKFSIALNDKLFIMYSTYEGLRFKMPRVLRYNQHSGRRNRPVCKQVPDMDYNQEKPLAGTPGVKHGEKEDTENRSG